jgi:hypothetical protein
MYAEPSRPGFLLLRKVPVLASQSVHERQQELHFWRCPPRNQFDADRLDAQGLAFPVNLDSVATPQPAVRTGDGIEQN